MLRKIMHYTTRPKLFGLNSWEKRNWGDEGDEQETGRQETTQTQTRNNYPESDLARTNWSKTLTDWGQPGAGYGANLPDYNAIFENAKKRINQYYMGSATSPGVIDTIKARGAQRGVQDSPAIDVLTSRMAAEEAGKIGDISTQVDTQKAQAIENARTNWLSSLTNLANLSPQSTTGTGTTTNYAPSTSAMDALGSLLGTGTQLAASYFTGQGIGSGLSSIFDLLNTSSSSGGVTSLANPYGSSYSEGLGKFGLDAMGGF